MDDRSLPDLSSLLVLGTHYFINQVLQITTDCYQIVVLWLNINYLKVVGSNPFEGAMLYKLSPGNLIYVLSVGRARFYYLIPSS